MSNDTNKNGQSPQQDCPPNDTTHEASLYSASAPAESIISAVVKSIKNLSDTVDNSLQDIRNALPADSDLQGIENELSSISQKLSEIATPEPVTPGGPDDWVISVYYAKKRAADGSLQVAADIFKLPVIYWYGIAPQTATPKELKNAAGWVQAYEAAFGHDQLVLRNGLDITGSRTLRGFLEYWQSETPRKQATNTNKLKAPFEGSY